MNIYVGNLSNDVTEDDLKKLFEEFGQVESVNIIKDRFSGQSRGFAFVEMPDRNEASTALKEADGRELNGKSVKVNEARGRATSGRRGGGGGPRGGFGGGGSRGGRGGGGSRGQGGGYGRRRY